MTEDKRDSVTPANRRRWDACQNEGCDGTMQTTRVTCGRDSGSEEMCNKCGRTVEHGWGGSRVLYEGRTAACANYEPSIANDHLSLCVNCMCISEEHQA